MNAVFLAALWFGHAVFGLLEWICEVWELLQGLWTAGWLGPGPPADAKVLRASVPRMRKLPAHVAVVLADERVSVRDLVRFVEWCFLSNIPYVSFYDRYGVAERNELTIRKEFAQSRPDLVKHTEWITRKPFRSKKNGISDTLNHNSDEKRVHVRILSNSDGKGAIVSLTRILAEAATAGMIQTEDINTKLINEKLDLCGLPNPDMAIVCGNTLCTYGLLPWHIPTTEFFLLPVHRDLSVDRFVGLLEKYATSEQRYGK
ncbi:dehydrodolichyl diphosphate synthase complex subunit nus1 [Orussus abietinus]|uniref:dehydrodolichyl diphosphate synthase complex subunit nus1 n=1 Tax=Orussus abietinus TaxID=222816 RepID=UPI000625F81D|nr:dehydrodolichyl diphosphate synthase complex subunit nus1 [Orussus abietinus]